MNKLRPMVSMELTDDEKLDAVTPIAMPDKPEFPYGMRICLTEAEFEKLKIDPAEAFVGGTFHLFGMARITNVSESDGPNGKTCRVECQIEDLAIESEDLENAEQR